MTSDEENREHRRGQQAGAKADGLTAFLVACDPFQSEHYRQGFNSAYAEKHGAPPPRLGRPASGASGGGGGGMGGDLPDSLGWIFALCLFVVLAPIGLALWLFRRWQRVLIGSAYLSWYYLAAWADRHGAPLPGHSYIVGWCYLICPLIACAIGDAKHRPLVGFLLGLFLPPVGIIIIVFLPEKQVEIDDDRASGVLTIIGRVLALVSLLIACFLVWRFEPGLRTAARTSATRGTPAAPTALGRWRILSYGSNTGNVSWQYVLSGNERVLQATGGTQHGGGNSIAITDRDIGDGVVSADVRPAAVFNAGHHTDRGCCRSRRQRTERSRCTCRRRRAAWSCWFFRWAMRCSMLPLTLSGADPPEPLEIPVAPNGGTLVIEGGDGTGPAGGGRGAGAPLLAHGGSWTVLPLLLRWAQLQGVGGPGLGGAVTAGELRLPNVEPGAYDLCAGAAMKLRQRQGTPRDGRCATGVLAPGGELMLRAPGVGN